MAEAPVFLQIAVLHLVTGEYPAQKPPLVASDPKRQRAEHDLDIRRYLFDQRFGIRDVGIHGRTFNPTRTPGAMQFPDHAESCRAGRRTRIQPFQRGFIDGAD